MRAIDADALQLAIVEEGQANKRKKYIIGDIWELTGAEIREVINSQPTIQPEIIRCKDCKYWDTTWQNDYAPNYHYCPMIDGTRRNDFYCAYAERKEETT